MEANRRYDWCLKPPEAEIVKQVVEQLLVPNSERIRAIAARGFVPVVSFEPMAGMEQIAPHNSIIAMEPVQKRNLGQLPETKKWFDRKLPPGAIKVFLVIHMGTYCMNWSEGHELYVEPGTLDEEWKA
jgi:hypothetical protein